jgi:hypothetical protein
MGVVEEMLSQNIRVIKEERATIPLSLDHD